MLLLAQHSSGQSTHELPVSKSFKTHFLLHCLPGPQLHLTLHTSLWGTAGFEQESLSPLAFSMNMFQPQHHGGTGGWHQPRWEQIGGMAYFSVGDPLRTSSLAIRTSEFPVLSSESLGPAIWIPTSSPAQSNSQAFQRAPFAKSKQQGAHGSLTPVEAGQEQGSFALSHAWWEHAELYMATGHQPLGSRRDNLSALHVLWNFGKECAFPGSSNQR